MRDLVQIADNKHLVRDIHSKAVLNTDKSGLEEYMFKRQLALKQQSEKNETNNRLEKLEKEMSEIKSILMDIAKMRDGNGD